ncbi:DNA glycosylase AlkZ-like family protein, partial [Actinotalea sp. JY-7885]
APTPALDPTAARRELARRYLRVLGPGTAQGFGDWAGLRAGSAASALASLGPELLPVRTDLGDAWVLAGDEADLRRGAGPPAPARLLASGDAYWLLQGRERELLVPDPARRGRLWTPRVWPGAVVVGGEVVGTWRRAGAVVTAELWQPVPAAAREAVEAEAVSLPLPGLTTPVTLRWQE